MFNFLCCFQQAQLSDQLASQQRAFEASQQERQQHHAAALHKQQMAFQQALLQNLSEHNARVLRGVFEKLPDTDN